MFPFDNVTSSAESWITNSARHLINLAAQGAASLESFEASNPLVQQAIDLAEKELMSVPFVQQLEPIANAVLSFAKAMTHVTTVAVGNAQSGSPVVKPGGGANTTAPTATATEPTST